MSEKVSALVFKKTTGTISISIEEVNVPAKGELHSGGMFCEWDCECPPGFVHMELFKIEPNGHKYAAGESRTLTSLSADMAEYNGQKVEITAIRKDGERGKAYYIKGKINEKANWVHEDRLV